MNASIDKKGININELEVLDFFEGRNAGNGFNRSEESGGMDGEWSEGRHTRRCGGTISVLGEGKRTDDFEDVYSDGVVSPLRRFAPALPKESRKTADHYYGFEPEQEFYNRHFDEEEQAELSKDYLKGYRKGFYAALERQANSIIPWALTGMLGLATALLLCLR